MSHPAPVDNIDFAIPQLPSRAKPAPAQARSHARAAEHDAIVQGTSDDALLSKYSCARAGYFRDPYLAFFLGGGPGDSEAERASRRAPMIHRGYWARVQAFTQIVQEFMRAGEEEGEEDDASADSAAAASSAAGAAAASSAAAVPSVPASPLRAAALPFHASIAGPAQPAPPPFLPLRSGAPPSVRKQIISLGAGSDTTYFRLKDSGIAPALFVEVDFPAPLAKKAGIIRRTPALNDLVQKRNDSLDEQQFNAARALQDARTDATGALSSLRLPGAHDYVLVGADLRDTAALDASLLAAGVDWSLPTLVLCECVLVYLPPVASDAVLELLASRARGGMLLVSYEQLHPETPFGQTMLANLSARGCPLLGLTAYPSLQAHARRYKDAGFDAHAGWSMNDIYRSYLTPRSEVRRVERLELFDEVEEWNLLQQHYHISMACVEPKDANLSKPSIAWRQLGLLHPARQQLLTAPPAAHAPHAAHPAPPSSGTIVTPSGRVIQLGVAAARPGVHPHTHAAGTTAHADAKGSLQKRAHAAPANEPASDGKPQLS